jgi:hypothetical protein
VRLVPPPPGLTPLPPHPAPPPGMAQPAAPPLPVAEPLVGERRGVQPRAAPHRPGRGPGAAAAHAAPRAEGAGLAAPPPLPPPPRSRGCPPPRHRPSRAVAAGTPTQSHAVRRGGRGAMVGLAKARGSRRTAWGVDTRPGCRAHLEGGHAPAQRSTPQGAARRQPLPA